MTPINAPQPTRTTCLSEMCKLTGGDCLACFRIYERGENDREWIEGLR